MHLLHVNAFTGSVCVVSHCASRYGESVDVVTIVVASDECGEAV